MTTIDELLDACPEDESIFLWYGVIWGAMLEAKDPRADGIEYLIQNRLRPWEYARIDITMPASFTWLGHALPDSPREKESLIPDKIVLWMQHDEREDHQYQRWIHGDENIGDAIRYFLDAYVSVYQPQTA